MQNYRQIRNDYSWKNQNSRSIRYFFLNVLVRAHENQAKDLPADFYLFNGQRQIALTKYYYFYFAIKQLINIIMDKLSDKFYCVYSSSLTNRIQIKM